MHHGFTTNKNFSSLVGEIPCRSLMPDARWLRCSCAPGVLVGWGAFLVGDAFSFLAGCLLAYPPSSALPQGLNLSLRASKYSSNLAYKHRAKGWHSYNAVLEYRRASQTGGTKEPIGVLAVERYLKVEGGEHTLSYRDVRMMGGLGWGLDGKQHCDITPKSP